jgi:lysophospholipase L1-like esterase
VLAILDDVHGYDIESVAHKGHPLEEMAYGRKQLEDLARRMEKVKRRGLTPKAILLSGGGNDVAGPEFAMLLNRNPSSIPGLNESVLRGVIDERIRAALTSLLGAITKLCKEMFEREIPIVIHGYDYPVPDGRGFWGGWWILPGPWLEPGFRQKGYDSLNHRKALAKELIDRFNRMIEEVSRVPESAHVRYVNLL